MHVIKILFRMSSNNIVMIIEVTKLAEAEILSIATTVINIQILCILLSWNLYTADFDINDTNYPWSFNGELSSSKAYSMIFINSWKSFLYFEQKCSFFTKCNILDKHAIFHNKQTYGICWLKALYSCGSEYLSKIEKASQIFNILYFICVR